jgi:hypothetical protein
MPFSGYILGVEGIRDCNGPYIPYRFYSDIAVQFITDVIQRIDTPDEKRDLSLKNGLRFLALVLRRVTNKLYYIDSELDDFTVHSELRYSALC